jgi:spermidine/putrescine transport system substrate-binding protein
MSANDQGPILSTISRRRFLKGTALAGVGAFLAACSSSGATSAPGSAAASVNPSNAAIPTLPPATSAPSVASTPKVLTGPLHWAQWPAYIDLSNKPDKNGVYHYAPGASPTLEQFKAKYKVDVDYEEKIEDNNTFYATIQPELVAGAPTGWDLIVITDWLAAKVITKGWAEQIDQTNVPNCVANLRDPLKSQVWDPKNDYHYPWQSGMTGIGYDKTSLASAKIAAPASLVDLWKIDPKKVSFLSEARDTFGLGLLKLGKAADPQQTSADDLQAVHDDIHPLVQGGLTFTGNEYLQNFAARKTWAAMVWSGDLASSGSADQVFVFPTEGTMLWTDNMVIPKGAVNIYTAETMMNFVYDPAIAGQIANFVYYVSPVKGADVVVKSLNASAPLDPALFALLFPPDAVVAKQRNFQYLPDALETVLNNLYLDLAGG